MRTALMLTSNEYIQRDVENDDKRRLVRLSELFVAFSLTRAKKMAANINATESNTLLYYSYILAAST